MPKRFPVTPEEKRIGAALKGAIKEAGLSQAEVARRLEIDQTALGERLSGKSSLSWGEIQRISDMCSLTRRELLTRAGILERATPTADRH